MKLIYKSGNQLPSKLPSLCAAIGIFDGVHRGHQELLKRVIVQSKRLGTKSAVITFLPHPVHVLRPDLSLNYLFSFAHRAQLLAQAGIEYCIVLRFTKAFANMPPESFIKNILVKQLRVKGIFVGDDFRFGRNRSGDVDLFKRLSSEYAYECFPVHLLKSNNKVISSTILRTLIIHGKLQQAKKLLGRDFSVYGQVIKGEGRGRVLGFATANIAYMNDVMLPCGVYAVRLKYKNKIMNAVANLGVRPTFDSKSNKPHLEVHVFNFKGSLYEKNVEVFFVKKIRREKKFATPLQLIAQIKKDIAAARKALLLS